MEMAAHFHRFQVNPPLRFRSILMLCLSVWCMLYDWRQHCPGQGRSISGVTLASLRSKGCPEWRLWN